MDERKRRIAENEARFRAINERLDDDLRRLEVADGVIAFVCECGQTQCTAPIELTTDEYANTRADRMLFVVAPGHEIPDTEDVVGTTDRFTVVRKHPDVEPIVDDS
jgi:hypothetical protein